MAELKTVNVSTDTDGEFFEITAEFGEKDEYGNYEHRVLAGYNADGEFRVLVWKDRIKEDPVNQWYDVL